MPVAQVMHAQFLVVKQQQFFSGFDHCPPFAAGVFQQPPAVLAVSVPRLAALLVSIVAVSSGFSTPVRQTHATDDAGLHQPLSSLANPSPQRIQQQIITTFDHCRVYFTFVSSVFISVLVSCQSATSAPNLTTTLPRNRHVLCPPRS